MFSDSQLHHFTPKSWIKIKKSRFHCSCLLFRLLFSSSTMLKRLRTFKPNIFLRNTIELICLLEMPSWKVVLTEYRNEIQLKTLVFRWTLSKWTSLSNSGAEKGPVSKMFADPVYSDTQDSVSECYGDLRKKVEIICFDTLLIFQLSHFCSNHAPIKKSCTLNQESRIGCAPVSHGTIHWIKRKIKMED